MSIESRLITAKKPRGFVDRRGSEAAAEEAIVSTVGRVYEKWGFERLETSAIEFTEALGKFLPDLDRPNEGVFSFLDDNCWHSLRYDLTAPLARFAAEERIALPKPYRRWQTGPVWRNEKPGPGRFRQFTQCDADTVGSDNPAADAEMVAMASEALEAVGVPRSGYVFKINSRRVLNGVMESIGLSGSERTRLTVMRALDKLDRVGVEGVASLLGQGRKDDSGDFTEGAKLDSKAIQHLIEFITLPTNSRAGVLAGVERLAGGNEEGHAGLKELQRIDDVLGALGVDDSRARFDPSIVRGLEYYTGAVYEAELTMTTVEDNRAVAFGAVGGGGRYDDLIARFTGERVPATGFSIGVSRLVAAQALLGQRAIDELGPVILLALEADQMAVYFRMAMELRAAGIRSEVYLGAGGMKAQMKYADKRAAPVVVIVGGDERARGEVTIKDMRLGAALSKEIGDNAEWRESGKAQISVARAALVDEVKRALARAEKQR